MRMSCNGCRVLRKGCNENCTIRPCLHWIKTADSQANATVFLAKFYGRAGLMNLINAAPDHLRPAVFRSLLYEACGRIVNPIYGSVGLLWSGNWGHCQTAVEAVLNGVPITQFASDQINPLDEEGNNGPPLKAYDIRHRSKLINDHHVGIGTDDDHHLHRVRTRCRFKKSSGAAGVAGRVKDVVSGGGSRVNESERKKRSASHESSLSHQYSEVEIYEEEEDDVVEEDVSFPSAAAAETKGGGGGGGGSHVEEAGSVELALTLGLGYHQSVIRQVHDVSPKLKVLPTSDVCNSMSDVDGGGGGETCRTELGL